MPIFSQFAEKANIKAAPHSLAGDSRSGCGLTPVQAHKPNRVSTLLQATQCPETGSLGGSSKYWVIYMEVSREHSMSGTSTGITGSLQP